MRYLLDTNIVSYFFQCRRQTELAAAATSVPMAIVEKVREELENDRQRGRAFAAWFPTSGIAERAIAVGSQAHATLLDLDVRLPSKRGRGERESISLATSDTDLVFVANDKNALWIALRELHAPGERILGLPVFLRRLRELDGLPREVVDDVMTISDLPKPTWWAGWIAPRPGG